MPAAEWGTGVREAGSGQCFRPEQGNTCSTPTGLLAWAGLGRVSGAWLGFGCGARNSDGRTGEDFPDRRNVVVRHPVQLESFVCEPELARIIHVVEVVAVRRNKVVGGHVFQQQLLAHLRARPGEELVDRMEGALAGALDNDA